MNYYKNVEDFISHRYVASYEKIKWKSSSILATCFSIVGLLLYKCICTYFFAGMSVLTLIAGLKVFLSKEKKKIFLSEGLMATSFFLAFSNWIIGILLLADGTKAYIWILVAIADWMITAIVEFNLTRRRIKMGCYSVEYRNDRKDNSDIYFFIIPGGYLAYKLATGLDSSMLLEVFLLLFSIIVIKIVESFMMHYYVNKYDLEDKIRIGDVRT